MTAAFLAALGAEGPAPDRDVSLYGWLAGSWALRVSFVTPDGARSEHPGEWHFGWVLEGRALQDVWIVPPRGLRGQGGPDYYGTTLRIPSPQGGPWRILYLDPTIPFELAMTGRREGEEIHQHGTDPAGAARRWRFSDITPESFRWRGEVALPDGAWHCHTDFEARRLEQPPTRRITA
ncbi:hypothetical protein JYK14_10535 [Siccirubricoccus sp. KC 17139]|uniref:DUF1579 domain-containing protein n=1 Tax=Siccirubricoccus soli TaxID=2899147 RepID=A0ABT1D3V1_9PROT|nr:hypothetical protein [Siccirubricoccus soli]MCO6416596.1 hypothetical protein [Siccirubricoccus soli]MCP2682731.1 hypothetical protein [Siccirubricoccus soli]